MFEPRRSAGVGAVAVALLVALSCSSGATKAKRETLPTETTVTTEAANALPNGFLVIPTPAGVDPEFFGQNVSITTTANGAPVVAFSILFEDAVESQVVTATYDESTHDFGPTVHIASAKLHGSAESVSITRDGSTLIAAWDDDGQILMARSTDDGATWTTAAVADASDAAHSGHSPSVAAAHGKVAIAFVDGNGVPAVATSDTVDAPFVIAEVPAAPNGPAPRSEAPAIAAAPDGSFGVSYFATPVTGGVVVAYLPVGAAAPTVTLDQGEAPSDPPSVALAFGPRGPVIGVTLCREPNPIDACTWSVASVDDGVTFGAAQTVPADGTDDGGRVTRVVVDPDGHGAFAYTPATSTSTGTAQCGRPKVATSTDLATWRTCSPDPQNTLALVPGPPSLAIGPDGGLVIAFQQMSSAAKAPTGVIVVVYPPLGAALISP